MPVQALPCPFCGGKQCPPTNEDGEYIIIEHDSWSCPMAAASGEVYQCIKQSDLSEWNERADIKE